MILVLSGCSWPVCWRTTPPSSRPPCRAWATLEAAGASPGQLDAVKAAIDPGKLIGVVTALLGGVAGILGSIAFLVLLLFFTVTDAATFAANLAKVSPAGRRLAEAFQLFARGSRQYLAVATIFGAGVALCDVVALTFLDIRYAWLWGLLAFVTNYIPNVGFLIGLLPPTIVALLDHDVETAIAVVVIYTVLNVILQSVIQPRVVGTTVGLSGTLSFLSLLIWTTILGGVGALLAVPASLFVKALFIDVDPERRWLTPLLSSSAEPDPAQPTGAEPAHRGLGCQEGCRSPSSPTRPMGLRERFPRDNPADCHRPREGQGS